MSNAQAFATRGELLIHSEEASRLSPETLVLGQGYVMNPQPGEDEYCTSRIEEYYSQPINLDSLSEPSKASKWGHMGVIPYNKILKIKEVARVVRGYTPEEIVNDVKAELEKRGITLPREYSLGESVMEIVAGSPSSTGIAYIADLIESDLLEAREPASINELKSKNSQVDEGMLFTKKDVLNNADKNASMNELIKEERQVDGFGSR